MAEYNSQTASRPLQSSGNAGDVFLVTGGTGFLGVAIVRLLLDKGHKVRVLVRNEDAVLSKEAGVEMCIGSVTDMRSVEVSARASLTESILKTDFSQHECVFITAFR